MADAGRINLDSFRLKLAISNARWRNIFVCNIASAHAVTFFFSSGQFKLVPNFVTFALTKSIKLQKFNLKSFKSNGYELCWTIGILKPFFFFFKDFKFYILQNQCERSAMGEVAEIARKVLLPPVKVINDRSHFEQGFPVWLPEERPRVSTSYTKSQPKNLCFNEDGLQSYLVC